MTAARRARGSHAEARPEMTDAPRKSGWANDSLFLSGDGLLAGDQQHLNHAAWR